MVTKRAASDRRPDLDWLRVLAILTVFVFHSGRFFDTDGWHVKNAVTYLGVAIWSAFLEHWMMPLIFVISGASVYYALGTRRGGRFLRERTLRLLVPLIVGVFTHIPLQVYLERLSHGQFSGSFLDFLPHYFEGFYGYGGNFAWMGLHLWYLELLFIFSIVLLPLFTWLRDGSGATRLVQLGGLLSKSGCAYLLAVPIILLLNVLNPGSLLGTTIMGGWSPVVYVVFFLNGFVLMSHHRLQESIQRLRWISLAAGAILWCVLGLIWASSGDPSFGTPLYALFYSLYGLSSWCWILTIFGFALRRLNFSTPFLGRASEAVLPFYVMHQTVLLGVGYFVVQWTVPDALKWLLIAAGSFAIILGLYQFVVCRLNVLRFLFGMRLQRRAVTVPLSEVADPGGS